MDQAWLSDEPAINFVTAIRKQPRAIHLLTKDAVRKDTMNSASGDARVYGSDEKS